LMEPVWAALCGALPLVINALLTGMPAMPRLAFMVLELAAYGLLVSLFYRRLRLPSFVSLLLAMIGGRAVYFVSLLTAVRLFGFALPWAASAYAAVADAVMRGLPGIAVQLVAVPVILAALKKLKVDG